MIFFFLRNELFYSYWGNSFYDAFHFILSIGTKYQVLNNHSLRIQNLNRNDAGDYKCRGLLITSLATQMKDLDIKFHVQCRFDIFIYTTLIYTYL